MRRTILALVFLCAAAPALAVQPSEILRDPVLEARARELSRELRCMVCQNQSIDDSDAPLARDLRLLVRERITAGDSNDEVLKYLTDRFGDFVLLRPRFTAQTALLWLVPPLFVLIGGWVLWSVARRQRQEGEGAATAAAALTPAEKARLDALIAAEKKAD